MTNTIPIDPNLISTLVIDLVSSGLSSISAVSIATNPIAQAGVDIVGKPLGWQQPPSVILSPSVRALLQGSPAAVAGGAIALKTLLFTEGGAALTAAPAASASLIGLALLVGVAIGTGIDYGIGAALNDKRIDTLSEWLATKWAESSSLPISQALPNEKGQWTTGWRYIPQNAPSGAPADPIRSPEEQGLPFTAPPLSHGEEMEMKRKKEETIGDRPVSHEALEVSSPKTLLEQLTEVVRKNPDDRVAWAVLADYLSEHGEPQRGELILLEEKIAQADNPTERLVLGLRKLEVEENLTKDLLKKLPGGNPDIHFKWNLGYLKTASRGGSLINPSWRPLDYQKFLDVLFQSEDSRFLEELWIVRATNPERRDCMSWDKVTFESSRPHFPIKLTVIINQFDQELRQTLQDWAGKNNIKINGEPP